jgi:hypothetical protein
MSKRKSSAAQNIPGTITSPALPGAYFAGRAALLDFVHDRLAAEAACAAFEADGDEFAFGFDMAALGYDRAEIAALIARPGRRPVELYATAA